MKDDEEDGPQKSPDSGRRSKAHLILGLTVWPRSVGIQEVRGGRLGPRGGCSGHCPPSPLTVLSLL